MKMHISFLKQSTDTSRNKSFRYEGNLTPTLLSMGHSYTVEVLMGNIKVLLQVTETSLNSDFVSIWHRIICCFRQNVAAARKPVLLLRHVKEP